jgi:glycosidase
MASKLKAASIIAVAISTLSFGLGGAQSADPVPAFDEATANTLAMEEMPRADLSGESIYFVMPDRYANGATYNDRGAGDFEGGFRPEDIGYFHGGDLLGLTENLDRIKDMGFTAIWITPVMAQQAVQGSSAAYHGYWGLDFTTIDPHFGDEEQFQDFVDAAHASDMKVYLDIVVNHTADVNAFSEGYGYSPISSKPYKDSGGNVVNLKSVAGLDLCTAAGQLNCFPLMNTASFPKTVVPGPNNFLKEPSWLRDPKYYNNRGSISDWSNREQMEFGDFVGLDDLMTNHPVVIQGMADIWADWITGFGIDGFRIDTARHVGDVFFNQWVPEVYRQVEAAGMEIPALFGEYALSDPDVLSEYVREEGLPSVLDFYASDSLVEFSVGGAAKDLTKIFAKDDLYNIGNDPVGHIGNAYSLVTFIGNHDKGRAANLIGNRLFRAKGSLIASRVALGYSAALLMRGSATVYYGDEVGMMGDGGDKAARQDMFPTQVSFWKTEKRAGMAPIGNGSSLTITSHPIMNQLKAVNTLRAAHPALADGAQELRAGVVKLSKQVGKPCKSEARSIKTTDGWELTCMRINKKKQIWKADYPNQVATWSRFDTDTNTEYVVLANAADGKRVVTVPTSTPSTTFRGILGSTSAPVSKADGKVTVTVPARGVVVMKADSAVPAVTGNFAATISYKAIGISGKPELTASVSGTNSPMVATFVYRESSSDEWKVMGADDNRTYRMVIPNWAWGSGSSIEFAAILRAPNDRVAVSPLLTVQKP